MRSPTRDDRLVPRRPCTWRCIVALTLIVRGAQSGEPIQQDFVDAVVGQLLGQRLLRSEARAARPTLHRRFLHLMRAIAPTARSSCHHVPTRRVKSTSCALEQLTSRRSEPASELVASAGASPRRTLGSLFRVKPSSPPGPLPRPRCQINSVTNQSGHDASGASVTPAREWRPPRTSRRLT